jgi:UDPglucose 6-dehydrogenase
MKISIIGTGYVGLVSGAIFSTVGHNVTCIDLDQVKIQSLSKAQTNIYEPLLQEKISMGFALNSLHFTSSYESVGSSDAVFIAVGTPQFENGDADLSFVYSAIDKIVKVISDKAILVIKSTVPPQTSLKISQHLKSLNIKNDVVMNPEFLREGSAVYDFLNPARIVIGCSSEDAKKVMLEIYKTWHTAEKIITDCTTAEMIKYASNTFLATKIAFINEMAEICEKVDANIEELSYGIGLDKRIGADFLKVGPGFGGSCFPKDINALIHLVKDQSINSIILQAVLDSNNSRKYQMLKKIKGIMGADLRGKKIGVLGLSFKANTDDVRYSPAIEIIKLLLLEEASVKAFDPKAMKNAKSCLPSITYAETAEDVFDQTECVVVLTEWAEFQNLDFKLMYSKMKKPTIIDLRNILNPTIIKQYGFDYYRI